MLMKSTSKSKSMNNLKVGSSSLRSRPVLQSRGTGLAQPPLVKDSKNSKKRKTSKSRSAAGARPSIFVGDRPKPRKKRPRGEPQMPVNAYK